MNQHMASPSSRSQSPVSPSRSRELSLRSSRLTLQVRIRGQSGPACQVTCTGLEDAIHFAQAQFPAFAERNPWLALDSLQHQIWILLDPETESTR
jgi:hypothetical protein